MASRIEDRKWAGEKGMDLRVMMYDRSEMNMDCVFSQGVLVATVLVGVGLESEHHASLGFSQAWWLLPPCLGDGLGPKGLEP